MSVESFDVLFVSFDPRDTPAKAAAARDRALEQYNRPGSENGWKFFDRQRGEY